MNLESFDIPSFKKGSGIHIKKKNRGKFTEYCDGKVTQKCIDKAKKSGNPKLRKRATFAENARKWKHQNGGSLYSSGNVVNTLYENATKIREIDVMQFGGKTKFHSNWLNQRIPILAVNANTSEKEAQKIANKQIEDLKNTPEYIYGTPKYYKRLSVEDQYDAKNALNDGAFALYDTQGKFIVYQDQFEKDLAKTHERTHAMNPIEQELAITKYKNEKRNIFADSNQKYDPYLDSSTEVYARLMDAREKYKLDPNKKYTKKDLQKLKEQIKKDYGIDDTVIFNRYNDDYILYLLNDIAYNDLPSNNVIYYGKQGRKLNYKNMNKLIPRKIKKAQIGTSITNTKTKLNTKANTSETNETFN